MASVSRSSRSRTPAPPVHPSIARPSFRPALLCGAGVLAAYILTLEPSVAGGDWGELIAAAKTMSAGHPPGYPLYLLLTRVFLFLPFQSIAWRASLASAFCGAAAAAALFWFIKEETRSSWAAFAGAGLFAFSRVVWQYATEADVFALNALFTAVLLCFPSRMEGGARFVVSRCARSHGRLLTRRQPAAGRAGSRRDAAAVLAAAVAHHLRLGRPWAGIAAARLEARLGDPCALACARPPADRA